jgi:L-amino acid N-acyltransferase YncA
VNDGREMLIIDAAESHLEEILDIYSFHVLNGNASWEYYAPSLDEMKKRFYSVKDNGFPYLVAVINGRVAGFAYANYYRMREGYKYTVEDTVYIHRDFLRLGIGKSLLLKLIEKLKETDVKNIIAVIGDSKNAGSIKLHESSGFVISGVLKKIGFKNNEWLDSVLMVKYI